MVSIDDSFRFFYTGFFGSSKIVIGVIIFCGIARLFLTSEVGDRL